MTFTPKSPTQISEDPNNRTNEAQTEHDLIRPLLDLLWGEGAYQVQVTIPNVDSRRQPDYAFFNSRAERMDADVLKGKLEYWGKTLALGDAKSWNASLDRQRGVDENPSGQIANYLWRSRVRWGILTNGKVWRLYERERSSAGGIFYEVDLEDLLNSHADEAFKYFYLFFRREAFLPDKGGVSFVERVFHRSTEYATKVGDKLKDSAYDALRYLMNGFFAHGENGLSSSDQSVVKLVHENSLIVLYRLLFILFAEDRKLLPRDDEPYKSHSLCSIHKQVNERLRRGHSFLPDATGLWRSVLDLFHLIDSGFPEGHIPAYNGGLFGCERYQHIAYRAMPAQKHWEIGEQHLAQAIDLLAYEREQWDIPGSKDVDYATLDVQHLGSIYEGLLELQPKLASEALVETKEEGNTVFKPEHEVPVPGLIDRQPPRRAREGEIYLVTDRGQRKATGSYYTPKYVVSYIIEHTIGPLVAEAAEEVLRLREDVDRKIAKHRRTLREWQNSTNPEAALQLESLAKAIRTEERRVIEVYLGLKILDPSMGSGHFLVGAADFVSLAMATDPNLVAPDEAGEEDPQAYYKRLVVEHCLYGVDLNPLAVELAKLSLWLHTVSGEKALSFLDHRLRPGDSLVGVRLADDLSTPPYAINPDDGSISANPTSPSFRFTDVLVSTHLQYLLDTFRKIMEAPSGNAETERRKDSLFHEMDTVRDKFRAVANCWLAPFFGVPVTPEQFESAVKSLKGTPDDWKELRSMDWFRLAQNVADSRSFLHWELEFPEVFFTPSGFKERDVRGFDAVIGNPPYVSFGLGRAGKLGENLRTYYEFRYGNSAEYKISVYAMFMQLAGDLSRVTGEFGLILPDSFLVGRHFSKIRKHLALGTAIGHVIRFKEDFWESGDVGFPVILVASRRPPGWEVAPESTFVAECETLDSLAAGSLKYYSEPQVSWARAFRNRFRIIPDPADRRTIAMIEENSIVLGSVLGMHHGVRSKVGRDKVVSQKKRGSSWRPALTASDEISRYSLRWKGNYINIAPELLFKGGWDATHIEQDKLLIRRTGDSIIATLDRERYYHTNALIYGILIGQIRRYDLRALLAVMNSRLFVYYYRKNTMKEGRTLPQVEIDSLEQFPIRNTSDRTQPTLKSEKNPATTLAARWFKGRVDSTGITTFVHEMLSQEPRRCDLVYDLLAVLAEELLLRRRKMDDEIKGFHAWLAKHIGSELEELEDKTTLLGYHEHDLADFLAALRENAGRLSVNPDSRSVQETIVNEFTKSVSRLRPIKATIESADHLVDQIVYDLYGLGDKEIAVVERAVPRTTAETVVGV
jgi:hypothetical protein